MMQASYETTQANLSILKTGKAKAIRFSTLKFDVGFQPLNGLGREVG